MESQPTRLTTVALAIIAVLAFSLAGFLGWKHYHQPVLGKASNLFINYASDVIGSKTGTTTAGVCFSCTSGGLSASTSYVSKLSGPITQAEYTLMALAASTSAQGGSSAYFDVQGSNDDGCETIATSTSDTNYSDNLPLVSDINWFDAANHLNFRVHPSAFSNASSSLTSSWSNPMNGTGQELLLTNLNYQCLRLTVRASSTILWAQIRSKGNTP